MRCTIRYANINPNDSPRIGIDICININPKWRQLVMPIDRLNIVRTRHNILPLLGLDSRCSSENGFRIKNM
jgi:hypothetical protein